MNVTYVVTTYGKQNLLYNCLNTFRKFHPDDPLIVVDNGGPNVEQTEAICKLFNALLFRFVSNGSLSKVMNTGMEEAQTPYVCICNNDLEFTTRLTEQFEMDFEKDPLIKIVGALLMYPDGRIQHGGGRRFWNHQAMGHYGQGKFPYQAKLCSIPAYRMYVTGAMSAVRKDWWAEHKYDEEMQMGCEDTDLCFRTWKEKGRVFYDPEITAIHLEGATRGRTDAEKRQQDPAGMAKEKLAYEKFKSLWPDSEIKKIYDQENKLNADLHPELPRAFVRHMAVGDVLRSTQVYDKLVEKNGPYVVITHIPEAFQGKNTIAISEYIDEYAVSSFLDLDLAYERDRTKPIAQSYFGEAIPDYTETNIEPIVIPFNESDWTYVRKQEMGFNWNQPYVVMHWGVSWPGKTMPVDFYKYLAMRLGQKGYGIVTIGSGMDAGATGIDKRGSGIINLVSKTNLSMLRAICEHAKLFIGPDSGPLHVADGVCPAIGLFTIARPENLVSAAVTGIMTKAECAGCIMRQGLTTNYLCEFKDNDPRQYMCVNMFDPEEILKKAFELLNVK
jgi:GT2 family glycosyltransferase